MVLRIAEMKEAGMNIGKRTHADLPLLQINSLEISRAGGFARFPAVYFFLRRLCQSAAKRGIDPTITREMVVALYHLAPSPPAYPVQALKARGIVPAKSRIVVMNPPTTATRRACLE
jgi:hypothetical protein